MAPVVHGLESQYFGQVDFAYLDIDDSSNAALMKEFEFRYQPMFVLVDGNGTPLKTWFGAVSAADFEAEFAKAIN
ncbi:MAG: thioredoxin family protein [Anaerolineae bacterium]|jgi:hypothetical protein|nr:thioredoxin family protein [Anaerolineae bacterium]MBT7188556.1 thioredoxin family protein [Anaerolineae bacterium]MBT7992121.1 thioredoxin family protein [Anaerolineae bacterium]